jgi:phosphinothricin acetyltransferase
LVTTRGGEVVGYAYVVLFRKQPAYRYTVKHSNPCSSRAGRSGHRTNPDAGTAALRQAFGKLSAISTRTMPLPSGSTKGSDSPELGLLPGVSYRHGRWADTIMVQRSLASGSTTAP